MTKDAKDSRGGMPHGKVALPEMLVIITSPAGLVETFKSDIYNNGEVHLVLLVRLACVHLPALTPLTDLHPSLADASQRLIEQLQQHTFHLHKSITSSYPVDGERVRTVVIDDDDADPASRIAKQLKELLTRLKKSIATTVAIEKLTADPSERLVCFTLAPLNCPQLPPR